MSEATIVQGKVIAVLGNNNYRVLISLGEGKEIELLCYLCGKMQRHRISVIPGDQVKVAVEAPFDRGRITFRE